MAGASQPRPHLGPPETSLPCPPVALPGRVPFSVRAPGLLPRRPLLPSVFSCGASGLPGPPPARPPGLPRSCPRPRGRCRARRAAPGAARRLGEGRATPRLVHKVSVLPFFFSSSSSFARSLSAFDVRVGSVVRILVPLHWNSSRHTRSCLQKYTLRSKLDRRSMNGLVVWGGPFGWENYCSPETCLPPVRVSVVDPVAAWELVYN